MERDVDERVADDAKWMFSTAAARIVSMPRGIGSTTDPPSTTSISRKRRAVAARFEQSLDAYDDENPIAPARSESSTLLDWKAFFSVAKKPLPWKSLPPDRSTMLIAPPWKFPSRTS